MNVSNVMGLLAGGGLINGGLVKFSNVCFC